MTGETRSSNFPVTTNALQRLTPGGGADAFVTKLNPTRPGRRPWSIPPTWEAVRGGDTGYGIAVDSPAMPT